MGRLILIRHGESQYNLEGRFTGLSDSPLTKKGRHEMETAGRRLREIVIDIAFSSLLRRSVDSTRIVLVSSGQPNVPVTVMQELNERSYGELEGLTRNEVTDRFGEAHVRLWRRRSHALPPRGESIESASKRILEVFRSRVLAMARQRNVLVCAHGNTLRAIVRELQALGEERFRSLEIVIGQILFFDVDHRGNARLTSERVPLDSSPGGSLL